MAEKKNQGVECSHKQNASRLKITQVKGGVPEAFTCLNEIMSGQVGKSNVGTRRRLHHQKRRGGDNLSWRLRAGKKIVVVEEKDGEEEKEVKNEYNKCENTKTNTKKEEST